jgi:two-component system, NarL family, nitrate/nitrite response regulator NarL
VELPNLPALTPRERDCMGHVALGRTDEEIAGALRLSPATVRHHLDNVRDKLGATTRAEAIALLAQSGEI